MAPVRPIVSSSMVARMPPWSTPGNPWYRSAGRYSATMRSPSRRKVSLSPDSLRWPQAKQRWYVVSSLSLSGSCTAADQSISRSGGRPSLDRRSEALAQLLETALSEQFAMPAIELLQAMPIPVAVVHAGDLRALAVNELMAQFLHRADAAGLPISGMPPPAHPLSAPRPYPAVASSGTDVARLRETNAAKTEFLNLAAHELRTPLSVILGYSSMLAQGGLSPEHQKLAGSRIFEKTRQLSRLIRDMSLVGRFDELGPSIATEPIDLVELLEPMVKDQQRRFPDLAIDFGMDVLVAPVRGNPYWLHLAIRELLDNAIRFRPGPTGRIDVTLAEADRNWSLGVFDDGFGVDPQAQGQLFKRFARI